jgi:hypothetical protein
MPTFCRHNRFLERCPVCSKTLPAKEPAGGGSAPRRARSSASGPRRVRGEGLKVRREGRALEDGYHNDLVPGLRASADARRLADEIAFAGDRLAALATAPPGLYGEVASLAQRDLERATWTCFLIAYLSPTEDERPFAAIETVLAAAPEPRSLPDDLGELLDEADLGPRTSHSPGRGVETLEAYVQWVGRAGGEEQSQAVAFTGDRAWTPQRRFSRIFERLALPGLGRAGRFELLASMGALGLYEMSAESLQLAALRGVGGEDPATVAAKRVFGIADPQLLDRRATALAEAASAPLTALDLALANWSAPQRATFGFTDEQQLDGSSAGAAAAALGV